MSSRITAIWRSLLSWMHWRRRRAERLLQQQVEQQILLEDLLRSLLWEAMQPMAQALQRLDSHQVSLGKRQAAMQMQQVEQASQLQDLLMEVLQGQQPSASSQLLPLLGPQSQPPSFQHSAS